MAEYALRLGNGVDTAPRVRMADALPLRPSGSLTVRSGLHNDGGGAVSVVAGTMQVQVSPLLAWVDGGSSTAQAGYPFVLDATKSLTLADGHATLSRTDTVAVVIHDTTYDGSGLTDASVVIVQGTPGAGAPTLPPTALPLRDVTVPAGLSSGTGGLASGNLATDRRAYLSAAGGVLRVASQTERDALTATNGHVVYRNDTKTLEVFNGTGWDTFRKDDGNFLQSAAIPAGTGSATSWSVAVTFPTPFASAPRVTITGTTAAPVVWAATAITASGFTAYASWADGGTHSNSGPANYVAHGARP